MLTGGQSHDSDADDADDKTTSLRVIVTVGLVAGLSVSALLIILPHLMEKPTSTDRDEFGTWRVGTVSTGIGSICTGFCTGVLFSAMSGALPSEETDVLSGSVTSRVRLAIFREQVEREVRAYESDVRVTIYAGLLIIVLHVLSVGLLSATHIVLGAVLGLSVGVAYGLPGSVFAILFLTPVAFTAGTLQQCLLGAVIGGAGCARFWIRFLQDKILYHPKRYAATVSWGEKFDFGGQVCSLQKISYSLVGRFCGKVEQTATMIVPETREILVLWIVFGGNSMLALDWLGHLNAILSGIPPRSMGFLLIDYPGYGWNGARPSPGATLAAAQAALKAALAELKTEPQVNLLGHSLGCAAVAQFAADMSRNGRPPGRMVLSAPFLDIPKMAMCVLGGLFPAAIRGILPPILHAVVPDRWDNSVNVPAAAKAGWRIQIMHGVKDEIVPFYMGRELFSLATKRVFSGKTVVAHSLKTVSLNGARGTVTGLQGDRLQVQFDQPHGQKALKQDNLRLVDDTADQNCDDTVQTEFWEVATAGHNDVIAASVSIYKDVFSSCGGTPAV